MASANPVAATGSDPPVTTTAPPLPASSRRSWKWDDDLTTMRHWLTSRLGDSDETFVAVTIINELAANALRHTRSGRKNGTYTVEFQSKPDFLWLAVTDQGGDTVPVPQPLDEVSESGRGLAMVVEIAAACSGMWGHTKLPSGRRTWVTLSRPLKLP